MSEKVLQFDNSCESYYDVAEKYESKGDLINAVASLKSAIEIDGDPDSRLKLAELYYNHGFFDLSQSEFMKLYPYSDFSTDCNLGLHMNSLQSNNKEASLYYFNKIVEDGISGDELEDIKDLHDFLNETESQSERDKYKVIYPKPSSDMLDDGIELMRNSQTEKAMEEFLSVPITAPEYVDARNNAALVCLLTNAHHEAINYACDVLKKDENNVFALCTMVVACDKENNRFALEGYLRRLTSLETKSEDEIVRIAFTLCEIRKHGLAYSYYCKLKERAFEKQIMQLKVAAAYNAGDFKAAKDELRKLSVFHGHDSCVGLFKNIIDNGYLLLPYFVDIPDELAEEYANEMFTHAVDDDDFDMGDVDSRDKIEFALFNSNLPRKFDKFLKILIRDYNDGEDYLSELMLERALPPTYKILAVAYFLGQGKRSFYYSIGDIVVKNNEKVKTDIENETLKNAYHLACAYFLCADKRAVRELREIVEKICEEKRDLSHISSKYSLAAALMTALKDDKYTHMTSYFIKGFSVSMTALSKNLEILFGNGEKDEKDNSAKD